MKAINSKTRYIGLLGHPLGHTFSPSMQNAALQNKGINMLYLPLDIVPYSFEKVVKIMPYMGFNGYNVTIPYKVDIIKHLNEIDKLAKRIGAVNTVTINDGVLKGYNTDGKAFLRSLEEAGSSVDGKSFFVLGSGGVSRAICTTLAFNKVRKIVICNRTYEKAVFLSEDINKIIPNLSIAIPMVYEKMKKAIEECDVLVNTTNIGTFPKTEETPIDKKLLKKNLIVYDVIYNPRKTRLLLEAEKQGCNVISGLGMLVYQGAEAFELWTGIEPPVEIMFDVLTYS